MKIAFFSSFILEYGGGLEKYLIDTAAHFAAQPDVTADVITMNDDFIKTYVPLYHITQTSLFSKKGSAMHKENLADILERLGKAHYYKATGIKDLRRRLKQYDVIYSKNELLEAFLLKSLVGYKHIPPVVFGGHTPLRYPIAASFHAKLHNWLYSSLVYRFLANGVERFHALNDYEAELYQRLFPNRPVSKIYNPFDIGAFRQKAKDHEQRLQTKEGVLQILWAGRLTEQKGVADLPELIAAVNQKVGNRVQWNIFGDGPLRSIVEHIAQNQLNVTYHGHIDQRYMASIYQQHQLFVSTSKWEGYPYTLIEPQAFGLAVFAYRIPGATDILNAYGGGHLADDVADMANQLVATIAQYTAPKYKPSQQFHPETIYGQLMQLLNPEEIYARSSSSRL